jgi:hypothetical protein
MLDDRDFAVVFHIEEEKDGYFVVLTSVDEISPGLCVIKNSGRVRGKIIFAGWHLKRISDFVTSVTYFTNVDAKLPKVHKLLAD